MKKLITFILFNFYLMNMNSAFSMEVAKVSCFNDHNEQFFAAFYFDEDDHPMAGLSSLTASVHFKGKKHFLKFQPNDFLIPNSFIMSGENLQIRFDDKVVNAPEIGSKFKSYYYLPEKFKFVIFECSVN